MVMAEGTAVLRRNRPGTKAQVNPSFSRKAWERLGAGAWGTAAAARRRAGYCRGTVGGGEQLLVAEAYL